MMGVALGTCREGYLPERSTGFFIPKPELSGSTNMVPRGGDEPDIIRPGGNYVWPDVTYGSGYDGTRIGQPWGERFEQPELFWVPSIAPSGMTSIRVIVFRDGRGTSLSVPHRWRVFPEPDIWNASCSMKTGSRGGSGC